MNHDFSPRRIGEILDDAIAIVRSNFRTLGPVTAVVLLPVAAAYSVVASFYMRTIFETIGQAMSDVTAAPPSDPMFVVIAMLMNGLGLLYFAARAMMDATLYANSAQLLERRRLALKEALGGGLRSVVPMVAVQMIVGLASGVAMVVVVMVAIVLSLLAVALSESLGIAAIFIAYGLAIAGWGAMGVLFSLASPAVVIEGGIGAALGRSFRLVRKHFWRVLAIVVASGLLVAQFESALAAPTVIREIFMATQSPTALFSEIHWGWKVFDGLVQGIAISVVLPFAASVTLLTYLDLRAREEGMDLVIRARKLLP